LKEILNNFDIPSIIKGATVPYTDSIFIGEGGIKELHVPDNVYDKALEIYENFKGGNMELKKTVLNSEHIKDNAKLVDFGGWEMPIQFEGILKEHETVRTDVGIFDVGHMGEISVKGKDAMHFVNYLITNDAESMENGEIVYSPMCKDNGTIVDDLLAYKFNEEKFLLVVNASNTLKDFEWISKVSEDFDVEVINISEEIGQIALQGPNAEKRLRELTDCKLEEIGFYHFKDKVTIDGEEVLLSRTGYTGEDGFEIYSSQESTLKLWRKFREMGIKPIGLGARDSLRFEACYMLYGNDIDETTTPLEAGLKWAVKLHKNFKGRNVLLKQKEEGLTRRLRGIEMVERSVPRHGYEVFADGKKIGYVTSGMKSPTTGRFVALAYLDKPYDKLGSEVEVLIHGKNKKAKVVKTQFYRGSVKSKK
jgi:aminomethyltransferase